MPTITTDSKPDSSTKALSVSLLILAEIAAMALWFVSAAIIGDMHAEAPISEVAQAALSAGVQAGFVIGALTSALLGLADRFDPRRVFAAAAIIAALCNALLLWVPIGATAAITLRFMTGLCLAGVYPVGMKIAIGWGLKDRGFLVGLLVGGLTLGSAAPHLLAFFGGAHWRSTVVVASVLAALAAVLITRVRLGPHHAIAPRFEPRATLIAWTDRRIRHAFGGYLGHMWELYAMWAWIGVATTVSYSASMSTSDATEFGKLTAFAAIGIGAFTCALAGWLADRIGKAQMTIWTMAASASAAILTAATFGGAPWITFVVVMFWGMTIVPDSAQFSALVADYSPPDKAGSLMTLQTALGFALTTATVQLTPLAAASFGWPWVLAALALGPVAGIASMWRLRS